MNFNENPECELSIVMPCLNESETLATCIYKARYFLESRGIVGEIIVADNGSSDESREIARAHGVRLVEVSTRGYGAALRGGIAAARSRYVIMGDADDSYDFSDLDRFVEKLRAGNELVMGNRFRGEIKAGAMPALHRYLGTPLLSWIFRLLYRAPIHDLNCGLRGFCREALTRLPFSCNGMEFASEMAILAAIHDLRIAEVATGLSPDGRSRPPHLQTWRDGWRNFLILLKHCPRLILFRTKAHR